jgi:D-xylose transport system ATP-binding protein
LTIPARHSQLGIATVFQDLALCENLDVVANIFLGHELNPLSLDEVAMEVRAWTLLNELSARIPAFASRSPRCRAASARPSRSRARFCSIRR